MKKKSKGERLGWRHLHEVEPIKLTPTAWRSGGI
jgi:hypothetical protein